MSEEQIFLAALDQPDAATRAKYLDEACQGNTSLREQVETLLAAHFQSGEFLDVPAPEQVQIETSAGDAVTILTTGLPAHHEAAAMNHDDDSSDLEFLVPSSRPDSLGRIGHYEVLQVIGKGGFGIVLRAFDDVLQRVVAIKVMAPVLAATSPARKRFTREARTSAQVRHENVVQVYEVGEQPLPYLVMEFIPGETLQQRLDRIGPLDVPEVVRIGRQIAEGLAAAHATDLIHRDIKPGNVLLEGGHLKVKITDFGLARAGDDASMTQSGMIAGTPMYMAPEQVLGQLLDQRADLFSLGTVMYQMASGRVPFRAPNSVAVLKRVADDTPRPIREVIPETPQWLCDIISKLHAKNPAERYQSAREVADVLADCEGQLKQNSRLRDYSRIPRSGPAASRGKWKWAAVAAAVLLPIVALAFTESTGVTTWFTGRQPVGVVAPPAMPISAANFGPTADGFEPLFNGKDLTGWKTHPEQPGKWEVKNGVLIGSTRQSNLFTERADIANFHLRAEVKINLGGDTGIRFRTPISLQRGPKAWQVLPDGGYEAEFNKFPAASAHSGSVWRVNKQAAPTLLFKAVDDSLSAADEWCLFEVIADGNRFVTKINGREAASCVDPQSAHAAGHIALQCFSAQTIVEFRKIEIKELPASPPVTEGFVALFNGQDLTGWKKHALSGGDWRVEDRAIDGRGNTSYLFTESGDYANFHLRVEAKINGNGDAGVFIRTPFDVRPLPISGPAKFTLLAGYEAAIALRASYPTHTGSLMGADGSTLNAGPLLPHKPDEWFVLEVIAEDNHIRTLVDGQPAADYTDENRRFSRGHIALQTWGPGITIVQFRRVEIKELPGTKAGPPLAIAPFDAAQAKAHQEAWASHLDVPVEFENSIGMKLRLVPPGKNALGAAGAGESGNAFFLGATEVTVDQFRNFVKDTQYTTAGEANNLRGMLVQKGKKTERDANHIWSHPAFALSGDHPVALITWHDAMAFCDWLSKKEGRTYRLPTIAEWRWAERAGSASRFYFGDDSASMDAHGWHVGNSGMQTHAVAAKERNSWGLFDMNGNVWELSYSWQRDGKPVDLTLAKAGPNAGGRVHFLGGGYSAPSDEVGTLANGPANVGYSHLGFRVAIVGELKPASSQANQGSAMKSEPPPLAVAPFDAIQAKNHQEVWANHLSVPVEYTNSIGMKFRLIPPGEFLMGASEKEIERLLTGATLSWQISRMKAEGPQQAMTVREPYYLGQHEVTLGQFRQFVQETDYKTTAETNGKGGERHLVEPDRKVEVRPDYIWSNPIDSPTDDHPVVFVSLEDARQFCLWLSKKDGRTYALPRDDQWEFACRGGTTTRWSDEKDVQRIAWVRENSEGRLHPIGQKAANPFELFDMHGNAAELCEPVPPKKAARRGGDSTSSVVSCRSASRWELGDSLPWYRNGFRVAIVGNLKPGAAAPASIAKPEILPTTYKNSLGMEFVIVPKGKS